MDQSGATCRQTKHAGFELPGPRDKEPARTLPRRHGLVIELVVTAAGKSALAVREAWDSPANFRTALIRLRQALFTVDYEIARLRRQGKTENQLKAVRSRRSQGWWQ
jgi:hypothetical protein